MLSCTKSSPICSSTTEKLAEVWFQPHTSLPDPSPCAWLQMCIEVPYQGSQGCREMKQLLLASPALSQLLSGLQTALRPKQSTFLYGMTVHTTVHRKKWSRSMWEGLLSSCLTYRCPAPSSCGPILDISSVFTEHLYRQAWWQPLCAVRTPGGHVKRPAF